MYNLYVVHGHFLQPNLLTKYNYAFGQYRLKVDNTALNKCLPEFLSWSQLRCLSEDENTNEFQ